ncbi:hypothetical protein TREMEDRAFT_64689 [Tremella mesenterica DSM 1558]|uniref:uncharacterized protein n=1 Tax=Tremella mesenterica (strain ATCC 24925 / CBS 8224 / DSM 1558 / NBRC 9311 / NRRL Y-6157 / RJB 2259-6 / UBC 559-6) TaxID=578456 RepID=UPI0003F4A373|nr:uncharacterized protein TREMEDRAFT_64689 [Tremella mesenterica DSM 1558]EIW67433.1 hypothetical protein TREMEDRAFT_64689 [Tremella mesenterica DSM 1558]
MLAICWLPWTFFAFTRPRKYSEARVRKDPEGTSTAYWEPRFNPKSTPKKEKKPPQPKVYVQIRQIEDPEWVKWLHKYKLRRSDYMHAKTSEEMPERWIEVLVKRDFLRSWDIFGKPKPLHLDGDDEKPKYRRSSGYIERTWDAFEVFSDLWRTLDRQGQQVAGVICGLVLLVMQIEMIGHDLSSDTVVKYYNDLTSGMKKSSDRLDGDDTCAYATGLGVANWGSGLENLAILCLMLVMEEFINVRLGLFAPQWNRIGTGYTIMFLACATLATSSNWGIRVFIRLRYVSLVAIFLVGLYNVVHTMIALNGCFGHEEQDSVQRYGRCPLRTWTAEEWADPTLHHQFAQNQAVWDTRDPTGGLRPSDEYIPWPFRLQSWIGDWATPLKRVQIKALEWAIHVGRRRLHPNQVEQFERYLEDVIHAAEHQTVYAKTDLQRQREKGQVDRTLIHGWPIKSVDLTPRQKNDALRRSKYNYGQNVVGLPDYQPHLKAEHYRYKYYFLWFDIRRAMAALCAVGLFGIHVAICVSDLGFSSLPAYNDAYAQAVSSWKSNGGPDPSQCQYFADSTVSIWVYPGTSTYRMVTSLLAWQGMWHAFIMGMCVGVFLVAWSNNRTFGMHLPFPPITLIGPRLSSNSMGWTLGFIAWATLQLGFFRNDDDGVLGVRFVCYSSLVCWGTFLFPNEHMRNLYQRNPFWGALSELGAVYMTNMKVAYHYMEEDDD